MSLRPIPLRLTVAAAALSSVLSAHAQQAQPGAGADPKAKAPAAAPAKAKPAAAPPAMQTVEVRGSADSYDPRRDDTASKIVMNHAEIVKYGDTNVLDVLKRLPGVTVSGGGGRGGEVRMRGLGSGYTQVLVNGERAPAGFSIDSIAPDLIERIEVLRAASAEFSTQSIAGTINIVLKKAIGKAQREIKAGLGGGQGNYSPSLNVQLSDRAGKLSYSLSFNAQHNYSESTSESVEDGRDAGGQQTILRRTDSNNTGRFSMINLGPRLSWALDNGDTLTSQSFIGATRFGGAYANTTTAVIGPQVGNPNIEGVPHNAGETIRTDLNWVHKLAEGAKLDVKLGANRSVNRSESNQVGFVVRGTSTIDRTVLNDTLDDGVSATGKYSTPIVEGHTLAAGWDGGASRRTEDRTQIDLVPAGLAPREQDFYANIKRLALYAQDEWNVTPRWSVYLGARWEGIETRAGDGIDSVDARTSVFSPLMHTLYKLPGTKGDQLRLALTRTYKAPQPVRLLARRSTSLNNSEVDPDFMGNPALRPELATGIDASYEHYWGAGALLSISASVRRIEDYTRHTVEEDRDGFVMFPINDGTATTRGLEVEVKFPLKAVMAGAPAVDLRASISRNWSSVDAVPGPDNRLDQQTPLSATVGFDYKGGALSAGGSFAFRSGGPVRVSVEQFAYSSPRRELETYALWKFDPKNQLRLTLSNILKQDWISETAFVHDGASLRRANRLAGKIQLRATMEMKY